MQPNRVRVSLYHCKDGKPVITVKFPFFIFSMAWVWCKLVAAKFMLINTMSCLFMGWDPSWQRHGTPLHRYGCRPTKQWYIWQALQCWLWSWYVSIHVSIHISCRGENNKDPRGVLVVFCVFVNMFYACLPSARWWENKRM